MPSLHIGWAMLVAIGLIAATRSRWRWLWLLHPLVTVLVVVATANHWWLDGIVVLGLLAGALAIALVPQQVRWWRDIVGPGEAAEQPAGPGRPGLADQPEPTAR